MKRPRLKKWAKWVCTLAAVLAVGAAVFSRFYEWVYCTFDNSDDIVWEMHLRAGQLIVWHISGQDQASVKSRLGWRVWWSPHWYWGHAGENSFKGYYLPWHAGVFYSLTPVGWGVGASVLYPVALTLIPATLLWYADRRRFGPGLCKKCGYDRRGLVGGADAKCPECGALPTR